MCTPGVVLSLFLKGTQAELVDVARDEALTAGGVCFARRWKLLTCTLNPGSGQVQLRRFCGVRGCSRRAFLCGEGGPAHRGLLSIHEPLSGAAVGATAHTGDGLSHVEYCGAPFNWVASAVLRTTVLHQIALCTGCRRPCQWVSDVTGRCTLANCGCSALSFPEAFAPMLLVGRLPMRELRFFVGRLQTTCTIVHIGKLMAGTGLTTIPPLQVVSQRARV